MIYMNELGIMQKANIQEIKSDNILKSRLYDLGLCEGVDVQCLGESPLRDPRAYLIGGAVIALRNADCSQIAVAPYRTNDI